MVPPIRKPVFTNYKELYSLLKKIFQMYDDISNKVIDIYLAERLNGISANGAWTITENAIRNTGEWRSKH